MIPPPARRLLGATHFLANSTDNVANIPNDSLKWHYGDWDGKDLDPGRGIFGTPNHGAFAHITVNSTAMQISHISSEGKRLYTAPLLKPRSTEQRTTNTRDA